MSWRQQILQRERQISSAPPRGVTTVAVHTGTVIPAVAVPTESVDIDAIPSANAVVVVDTTDVTACIVLGSIPTPPPPQPPTVDEARLRDLIDVINSTIPLTLDDDDNNNVANESTWWQRFPLYFVLCPVLFFAAIMMGLAVIRANRNGGW